MPIYFRPHLFDISSERCRARVGTIRCINHPTPSNELSPRPNREWAARIDEKGVEWHLSGRCERLWHRVAVPLILNEVGFNKPQKQICGTVCASSPFSRSPDSKEQVAESIILAAAIKAR
jgi:hypothetical protein